MRQFYGRLEKCVAHCKKLVEEKFLAFEILAPAIRWPRALAHFTA